MAEYNQSLNKDTVNTALTSARHDGTKWVTDTAQADGDNATMGAKADAKATNVTSGWSLVSLLKGLLDLFLNGSGKVTVTGSSLTYANPMVIGGYDGSATQYLRMVGLADGLGQPAYAAAIGAFQMGHTGSAWDKVRVANVFKYAEAASVVSGTSLTVWTPGTGKKFRIMGIVISATAPGVYWIRDSATTIGAVRLTTGNLTVVVPLGQGRLSSTANNLLQVRNQSGNNSDMEVTAWGTEE